MFQNGAPDKFPDGLLLERLLVLHEAHQTFWLKKRNLHYERPYVNLYEDILACKDVWFEGLFSQDGNCVYAERCIGILGSLATIHRQRGDLTKTEEVLVSRSLYFLF